MRTQGYNYRGFEIRPQGTIFWGVYENGKLRNAYNTEAACKAWVDLELIKRSEEDRIENLRNFRKPVTL